MKSKISGFDELGKQLKDMQKAAKKLGEEKSVPFGELFTDSFMRKYTNSENIDVFFEKSSFKTETEEDFDAIDETELDSYVQKNSKFSSWKDMLDTAGKEYMIKKLGL